MVILEDGRKALLGKTYQMGRHTVLNLNGEKSTWFCLFSSHEHKLFECRLKVGRELELNRSCQTDMMQGEKGTEDKKVYEKKN